MVHPQDGPILLTENFLTCSAGSFFGIAYTQRQVSAPASKSAPPALGGTFSPGNLQRKYRVKWSCSGLKQGETAEERPWGAELWASNGATGAAHAR